MVLWLFLFQVIELDDDSDFQLPELSFSRRTAATATAAATTTAASTSEDIEWMDSGTPTVRTKDGLETLSIETFQEVLLS